MGNKREEKEKEKEEEEEEDVDDRGRRGGGGGRGSYLLPSNRAPGRAFPLKREAAGPQKGAEKKQRIGARLRHRGKRGERTAGWRKIEKEKERGD